MATLLPILRASVNRLIVAFTYDTEELYVCVVQVSKDIDVQFKGSEQYKQLPPGMDAHIRVLTSGFWPTYPVMDITLPEDIRK